MAMPGRKPSDRPTVTRHKPTHDWTEILNVPYSGDHPELPLSRTLLKGDEPIEIPIENRTRDWWIALCKMPHCVLWQDSDWAFALDTAMVQAAAAAPAFHGIRYVDPEPEAPVIAVVSQIDDRRQKLMDA